MNNSLKCRRVKKSALFHLISHWIYSRTVTEDGIPTTFRVGGEVFQRIRYEEWGADRQPCHDCGVAKDEFQIFGCDVSDLPDIHTLERSVAQDAPITARVTPVDA